MMEKIDGITNDELEIFSVNFSICSGVDPLNKKSHVFT